MCRNLEVPKFISSCTYTAHERLDYIFIGEERHIQDVSLIITRITKLAVEVFNLPPFYKGRIYYATP
jgi:hypothetical protein